MEDFKSIQEFFFQCVKEKLPPNYSLVDDIADRLNISNDSAYRRIRGETSLSFDEIQILSSQYDISIDTLFSLKSNSVSFTYRAINQDGFSFKDYLASVLQNLTLMTQFENKELIYAAKDIPLFHYFQCHELTTFKIFFWMNMLEDSTGYFEHNFDFNQFDEESVSLAQSIWKAYTHVPSIEIWSNETINVTLRQIEYCWECGLFKQKDQAILLCEKMLEMISHTQKQAELGYKFENIKEATSGSDNFKLYYNEITISDNTIFFIMDDTRITHITHNLMNILTTTNERFSDQTERYLKQILRKSSLISSVSEKERNKFFLKMKEKITQLMERIV
ncbi:hypothetical protein QQ008_19135 [Fulvivirgaceae bacterium BMA10]|uniref:HTH cro/C1-type domain-containing protein n=1 Tax=Splendidivirga corallicola TaxID=3051826 RepID=A0ABT8KRZ3_9BACT|nr:hypothetical protein [Fulvivirgaceae bacterium BMA10]